MGALWDLAVLAAFIVFVVALVQGKGFFNALRMGIGVLVLGFVGVVGLQVLAGVLSLAVQLLILAIWIGIIVAIVNVVTRVIKGTA